MNIRNRISAGLGIISLLVCTAHGFAAETNNAAADLNDLITRINAKLRQNKTSETDLADNIKEFDALLAKHRGGKPEDLSKILLLKARLYWEVLREPEKALPVYEQIRRDFPQTKIVGNMDEAIKALRTTIEKRKIQRTLAEGITFPDFQEKAVTGKLLSPANYRGKVVLIDFWATWCGPCLIELPNVLNVYQKYHDQGLEIIGISLDQDQERLVNFTKKKNMPWPQFFDGKVWDNKLVVKYGVEQIPTLYLLDREGKIIGKDLRGRQLEEAVAKALAKDQGRPTSREATTNVSIN
jgi:thiol-disulfide isomerase/thioredoxin